MVKYRSMLDSLQLLLPRPRETATPSGGFALPDRPTLALAGTLPDVASRRLLDTLAEAFQPPAFGVTDLRPRKARVAEGSIADIRLELDSESGVAESYRLEVGGEGIRVRGADPAGLFYGVKTLAQWLRIHLRAEQSGQRTVPALRVTDRPDFPHRGVLLDISRDKMPRVDTLKELIDLLAGWKINQLQLYMEHTFAYPGHEIVWQDASPLTGSDLRELDAYCRDRHIELVPNQNSFGHFHRWLAHEPYRWLAESPEGIEHPFSVEREPYSLCPTDPRSLDHLAGLYNQLLPYFKSRIFNVGLDETFDLGVGRSARACAERGKGRVYLDFLHGVHRLVSERGRQMQFWGDVILGHPELLDELPRDATALEWGYEADHPFAEDARRFAASGLDFYVCPGTSSWNSFAGRTENAVRNLASAAVHGQAHGASGYLITDWGDNGHLQPLPVSYPGFAAGAAFAWNVAAARKPHQLPLEQLLDLHAFRDPAGVMGAVACRLGNAYLETGAVIKNSTALFNAVIFAHESAARRGRRTRGMTAAHLERTLEHVEQAVAPLSSARMERRDADLIRRELGWAADALRLGCRLGSARLEAGEDQPLNALPNPVRTELSRQLDELIDQQREIWLVRNQPGGLDDSAARLIRVRQLLDG